MDDEDSTNLRIGDMEIGELQGLCYLGSMVRWKNGGTYADIDRRIKFAPQVGKVCVVWSGNMDGEQEIH